MKINFNFETEGTEMSSILLYAALQDALNFRKELSDIDKYIDRLRKEIREEANEKIEDKDDWFEKESARMHREHQEAVKQMYEDGERWWNEAQKEHEDWWKQKQKEHEAWCKEHGLR